MLLQVLIYIFDFGYEKLRELSRNEPLLITVDLWVCGLCLWYLELFPLKIVHMWSVWK